MRASVAAAALLAAAALAGCAAAPGTAEPGKREVVAGPVEYRDGETTLEGWLAYDPARPGRRPGVLVVHEWWGLGDHAKRRAEALARAGWVAFALDMYGKGKLTDDPKQAGAWAGEFRADPALLRTRAAAGLAVLAGHERVDPARLAAIGFCFGGTTVLELAYSGADLRAVVSFHGNPTAPKPEDRGRIQARILVCHGADDPLVPPEALAAFEAGMREAKADWVLVKYGGAVHSFTNPAADGKFNEGVRYDPAADRRSFEHMKRWLED